MNLPNKTACLPTMILVCIVVSIVGVACGGDDAGGMCASDVQCKGDRVCEDGACMDPGDASSSDDRGSSGSGDDPPSVGGGSGGSVGPAPAECESTQGIPCDEFCTDVGLAADGCDGSRCACGEPLDPICLDGAVGYCTCADAADQPCTDEDLFDAYIGCYQRDPDFEAIILCHETWISADGATIDCQGAATCLN